MECPTSQLRSTGRPWADRERLVTARWKPRRCVCDVDGRKLALGRLVA